MIDGIDSATVTSRVENSNSAIFVIDQTLKEGAFVDSKGQLVAIFNRARSNDVISIYANGLGLMNPRIATNEIASTIRLYHSARRYEVFVNNERAEVLFSGLAPTFIGLNQINVRLPRFFFGGTVDVQIRDTENGNRSPVTKIYVSP